MGGGDVALLDSDLDSDNDGRFDIAVVTDLHQLPLPDPDI